MEVMFFVLGVFVGVVLTLVLQTVAIMWHEEETVDTERLSEGGL